MLSMRMFRNPIWIYVLGILPYGFFYYRLKAGLHNDLLFGVLSLLYLLLLRVVATKVSKVK
jgi:hypothetical protein